MLSQYREVAGLYSREASSLRRHLQRKLGNWDSAEDVLQDAYLRMLTMPTQHAKLLSPRAFLFTVAGNLAVDTIRREQRMHRLSAQLPDCETAIEADALEIICPQRSVEDQVDAKQRLTTVMLRLAELAPKCQLAFVLHKFQELSYAEVATRLDITVSMVEKYLSRALQHLRQYPELFEH